MNDIRLELIFEIEKALENLKKAEQGLDGFEKKTKNTGATAGRVFSGLKAGIVSFVGALGVREVVNFTTEATNLAGQSQDLRRALGVLAKQEGLEVNTLMKDLRIATRGAVNDIELMQKATRGKFLGIDLKNLPVLLDFARQRAKDTGEDIDFLVNSIVTGIGRKSALILDNLGITMNQLKEAVQEVAIANGTWTGKMNEATFSANLQAAAVLVAKKALDASGESINTVADDLKSVQTEITNAKIRFGELAAGLTEGTIVPALGNISKAFNGFLDFFGVGKTDRILRLAGDMKALEDSFGGQERKLNDLVKRYRELLPQADNNEQAQQDLKSVIQDIVRIVPGAATGFDKYGKALDVNLNSVNAFIDGQRELLKRTRADVLKGITGEIRATERNIRDASAAIKFFNQEINNIEAAGKAFEVITAKTGSFRKEISKEEGINRFSAKVEESRIKLEASRSSVDELVVVLNKFFNLETINSEKLATELKITSDFATELIDKFKELNQPVPPPPPPPDPGEDPAEIDKKAKEAAEREEAARLKAESDLAAYLLDLRTRNQLLIAESDLQAALARIEAEKREEEIALADRLGIEQAYLLERSDLRRRIAEQDAEALRLVDENAEARKRQSIEAIAKTSSENIARLQAESALLGIEEGLQRELAALQQGYEQKRDLVRQQIAELQAIEAQAETENDQATLESAQAAISSKNEELLLLEGNYLQQRNNLHRSAADEQLTITQQLVRKSADIFSNAFVNLADSLADSASKGSEAWSGFFKDIKREIVRFLAAAAVKRFLSFIGNAFLPGGGGIIGGIIGGAITGAQTGEYIPGSREGKIRQVGENNTDEIIIPIHKFLDFMTGNYRVKGGIGIDNIPSPTGRRIREQAAPLASLRAGGVNGGGSVNPFSPPANRQPATSQQPSTVTFFSENLGREVTVNLPPIFPGEDSPEFADRSGDPSSPPVSRQPVSPQQPSTVTFFSESLGREVTVDLPPGVSPEAFPEASGYAGGRRGDFERAPAAINPLSGLSSGKVFAGLGNISIPSVAATAQPAVSRLTREHVIEKLVPIAGEFTFKTVAPELAEVRDHYIEVNRSVLRPDNRYADQFLQTDSGEFD